MENLIFYSIEWCPGEMQEAGDRELCTMLFSSIDQAVKYANIVPGVFYEKCSFLKPFENEQIVGRIVLDRGDRFEYIAEIHKMVVFKGFKGDNNG